MRERVYIQTAVSLSSGLKYPPCRKNNNATVNLNYLQVSHFVVAKTTPKRWPTHPPPYRQLILLSMGYLCEFINIKKQTDIYFKT